MHELVLFAGLVATTSAIQIVIAALITMRVAAGITWRRAFRACGRASLIAIASYLVLTLAVGFVEAALHLSAPGGSVGQLILPMLAGCGWLTSVFVGREGYPQTSPVLPIMAALSWILAGLAAAGLVWVLSEVQHWP